MDSVRFCSTARSWKYFCHDLKEVRYEVMNGKANELGWISTNPRGKGRNRPEGSTLESVEMPLIAGNVEASARRMRTNWRSWLRTPITAPH